MNPIDTMRNGSASPELLNLMRAQAGAAQGQPVVMFISPEGVVPQDAFQRSPAPAPAGTAYGIQNVGMQTTLPVSEKRPLTPQETVEIQRGLTQWWPRLFNSYATPVPQLLAAPAKSAVIGGVGLGLLGGLVGLTKAAGNRGIGLLLAAGLGLVGAVIGYFGRRQRNENLVDIMQRLPGNYPLTKRDLMSDKVFYEDSYRASANASAAGNLAGSLVTASLLNSTGSYGFDFISCRQPVRPYVLSVIRIGAMLEHGPFPAIRALHGEPLDRKRARQKFNGTAEPAGVEKGNNGHGVRAFSLDCQDHRLKKAWYQA
jgi:hypothetical protein